MNPHALFNIAIMIWYVAVNDRAIAAVVGRPWPAIVLPLTVGVMCASYAVREAIGGDWPMCFSDAIIAAMAARILWHWWRARRKGTPSRVLGLVRDLGGKLAVVPVRTEGGGA